LKEALAYLAVFLNYFRGEIFAALYSGTKKWLVELEYPLVSLYFVSASPSSPKKTIHQTAAYFQAA
jgi:hypothetical protein